MPPLPLDGDKEENMLFETTTIQDVLDKSTTVAVNSVSIGELALALVLAFVIGMLIFVVYKRTYNGVMYNRSFNISLVMLLMVTTLIIRCITSNLTLSLGMVGALSIVRFRTAIKDPMDTVFMFWAIAAGICIGAGASFYLYVVLGSLIIGVFLYVMYLIGGKGNTAYLLIVRHQVTEYRAISDMIGQLRLAGAKIVGFVYNDASVIEDGEGVAAFKAHFVGGGP